MYSICLLVAVTFVPSQPPQHTLRAQLEAAGVVPFTAYAELPAAVSHLRSLCSHYIAVSG